MKINLRKNSCPDYYRGLGSVKKIIVVGWEILNDEDLSYLLRCVLAPAVMTYSGKIILK